MSRGGPAHGTRPIVFGDRNRAVPLDFRCAHQVVHITGSRVEVSGFANCLRPRASAARSQPSGSHNPARAASRHANDIWLRWPRGVPMQAFDSIIPPMHAADAWNGSSSPPAEAGQLKGEDAMSEEADVLSDVDRPETVRDFWNRAHGTDRTLWLTGSPGPEVWHRLGVEERVRRGAVVLN